MRKLDDTTWNQDQAVRRFCTYLQAEDSGGLEAAVRALNRLDCWRQAVNELATGPSPNRTKGCALLSFWYTYGLHSVGRGLKGDLPHLVDAFRYLLPPYTGGGRRFIEAKLNITACDGRVWNLLDTHI